MTNDMVIVATPVPAVKGRFGRLRTFSTSIRAVDLVRLLEHDPRKLNQHPDLKEIYKEIQRILTLGRRRGIEQYLGRRLRRNEIASFPAISIGLTHAPAFVDFEGKPGLGEMYISEGLRLLLDGFGRSGGTLDFIESDEGKRYASTLTLPVVFYAPLDKDEVLTPDQLAILFADFNYRVNPVQDRLAMVHDPDDLYIQMTRDLRKEPFLSNYGGVEDRSASLGSKSKAIMVQKTLLRVVRGAVEGRAAQESNVSFVQNAKLTDGTYDDEYAKVAKFFNELSDHMGSVKWGEKKAWHLTPAGAQAIGLIAFAANHGEHELTDEERKDIYKAIALTTDEEVNNHILSLGIKGGGRSSKQAIVDLLMNKTKLAPPKANNGTVETAA